MQHPYTRGMYRCTLYTAHECPLPVRERVRVCMCADRCVSAPLARFYTPTPRSTDSEIAAEIARSHTVKSPNRLNRRDSAGKSSAEVRAAKQQLDGQKVPIKHKKCPKLLRKNGESPRLCGLKKDTNFCAGSVEEKSRANSWEATVCCGGAKGAARTGCRFPEVGLSVNVTRCCRLVLFLDSSYKVSGGEILITEL